MQNYVFNERMMKLHLISYALFIVSLVFYLGSYVTNNAKFASAMTVFVSITTVAS